MNEQQGAATGRVYSLSIELWHEMGLQGDMLPVTICLEGDSMRPLIRRGLDRVTIVPLNRPLKTGDIVLFQGGPDRYVVHRIRHIKDGKVQTLGDNCYYPDRWMPVSQVWGLVIKMERDGRTYRLDTRASRIWGRFWMAVHPLRILYRRCRSLAARCVRKVFPKGGRTHGT